MTWLWLVAVAQVGAPPAPRGLSLGVAGPCDKALVTAVQAELAEASFSVHPDPRPSDAAAVTLACAPTPSKSPLALKAHVEALAAAMTVDREFAESGREVLAVKLSEFIRAMVLAAEASRAAPDESAGEPFLDTDMPHDGPAPVPPPAASQWYGGVAVSAFIEPTFGVTAGLGAHVARIIDAWEVGALAQGGLTFSKLRVSGGSVDLTLVLVGLTVARRFSPTPRLNVRVLAGPGGVALFSQGSADSGAFLGNFAAGLAFAALLGVAADYEVANSLSVFTRVTTSWTIPRPILRLPEGDRSVTEPLVTLSAGVLFQ